MSYSNLKSVIENISVPQDWVSAASLLKKFPSNSISEGQAKTIYSALIQAAGTTPIPKNRIMLLRSSIASFVKATRQVAPIQEVKMLRQRFLMGEKSTLQKQDLNYLESAQPKIPQNIRKAVNPNHSVVAVKNHHSTVRPILQIIVKKNNPSRMSQIHNSLGILESYSRQHMKRGFSSTTFQPGSHYLGVKQSKQYGQTILIPHEQISRLPPKTPDIEANFKWYAGNSINKWNQFVTAQSKFRKFVDSISSSQKIQNYYVTQIAKSTRLTWAAEVLATCIYYYYHLPLIRLLTSSPSIATSQMANTILQQYQIGSKNPLGLSDQQGLQVIILIFNPVLSDLNGVHPIQWIHATVIDFMAQMKFDTMGRQAKQNGEYLKNYLIQRQGICSQYYSQQGIDSQIIQKSLSKPVAYDIKFMQSPLPSLEQNQYLKSKMLQVIDSDKNVNPEKQLKDWNYTWNSQRYPCYDYLFS